MWIGRTVNDVDPRNVLEKFADVSVRDISKDIRGNGRGDVHISPLLHDCLGIALAFGGDRESFQLDYTFTRPSTLRAAEVYLPSRSRAGGDVE